MQRVLITGGTGSFGQALTETLLSLAPALERLVIYSRDELKQFEMSQRFSPSQYPAVRYFLGDVRDLNRLRRALEGIDTVIHAAALKQVPVAEYNPFEFIKTNILGAQNLIEACLDMDVKTVVALSTDKAAAPINLYGATKLCSDKLFTAANNIRGNRQLRFSVVRYGNVMCSRGSVIPFFLAQRSTGVLPITDPDMTRFNITLPQATEMVLWALKNSRGGEIFVPRIPSYRIVDLAEAIGPECEHRVVGVRPGEKVHEEMITESDSLNTIDIGKYYAITPSTSLEAFEAYLRFYPGSIRVEPGFSYNSGANGEFLGVDDLRHLIRDHLDPDFTA